MDILVVVDYQKDFVNGALGFKKAETLEEGIYNKVNDYLKKGNEDLRNEVYFSQWFT